MPLSYKLDRTRQLLIATAEGEIHQSDVLAHLQKEAEDQLLEYSELIIAIKVTVVLTSGEVREIVDYLRYLSQEHKLGPTAIVVSNDFAYGMMRMLGILVDQFTRIEPFRSVHEADSWLRQVSASQDHPLQ